MPKNPERALRARAAAHLSWSRTDNPTERTAPGRVAFLQRFYDQVDPDRTLTEAERERRAAHARRAHFAEMAARSAQARRRYASERRAGMYR